MVRRGRKEGLREVESSGGRGGVRDLMGLRGLPSHQHRKRTRKEKKVGGKREEKPVGGSENE